MGELVVEEGERRPRASIVVVVEAGLDVEMELLQSHVRGGPASLSSLSSECRSRTWVEWLDWLHLLVGALDLPLFRVC